MAITVKHSKVSAIPDTDDDALVRPSDWNADHTLVGTIDVANGGTGASTLTGYVKGNGTSAMTASATVPSTDITGLGTISTQNANAVAITGGTINGTTIGATTPAAGTFTTLTSSSTATLANGSTTYVTITGDASYPMIKATGGTNTPLVLSPLGTGALQAQKTDSTATGGNARGANAVDWQTLRNSATEVASGSYSIVGGGQRNTASGSYSQSLGGFSNASSGFESVLVGGQGNAASGQIVFIGGGTSNTASGYGSNVVGGTSNTGAGVYSFIGAGQLNSGTSGSIVTTQSATMNATTAVTLSGSNANIKVGQYISGTSIGTDTYVAAISGTSLTLSKVASGSSTSTLSFYTPHGVVVGGGNNQATGSYSFIGGGGDAGTAANRNVASGDWSVVNGGTKNVASSNFSAVLSGGFHTASTSYGSVVCGGGFYGNAISQFAGNTASGTSSFVGSGFGNTASGGFSSVSGGGSNIANSNFSTIVGGYYGTTRSIAGNMVFSPSNNPIGTSANGTQQTALLILSRQTTDATATALTSDTSAASGTNQVILPNNSAYFFTGEVVSGVTGGGNTKGWTIEGVIKRGVGVGTTALVGTPTVVSTYADVGAATWVIAVTADTTNGGIRVTFTGQLATTIRTVCQIRTTEMTY
jgi:hypothetical protein